MARSSAKNAHKVNLNIPVVRGPFDRVRTAVCFDPEKGLTHQSFKDECDIHRIVETYARTGIIPRGRKMEPMYGEAPETTLFEAACAQAAIRTAEADGFEYPEIAAASGAEDEISEKEGEPQGSPDQPADGESGGHDN